MAIALALVTLLAGGGCATYSERMLGVRESAARADWEAGIEALDEIIGVDEPDALPNEWKPETGLALLERGTLHQASADYAASARDFQAADKELEFIDLTNDAAGQIGKYIYSDSATNYRSSATEKLALNSLNMMNYLALGDLSGARVEIIDRCGHFPMLEQAQRFSALVEGFVP